MTFGEKIVYLRKLKGLSQDQLAEQLGVTRQSISKWERDEVIADTDRVLAISKLFGVSCDYLLDDTLTDASYGRNGFDTASQNPRASANTATVPPLGKNTDRSHWHWLGLIPLLWGIGDLLMIRYIFTAFIRIRIQDIPFLIYQLFTSYPQGIPIFLFCLLILVFMLAKIGIGLFLIIHGCKRNTKLARETQQESSME